MAVKTKLPVGFENFGEIRREDFYYVDKTEMIRTFLENPAKVTLFTRPRRFGKTLNMSMLKHFFEAGCDPALFDGLKISKEKDLCEKYMGKFPVISITLKDVAGENFERAKGMLCQVVAREALRFPFLENSERLSELEHLQYQKMIVLNEKGVFSMTDELLTDSLSILSRLLQKHCGENTILLIDEYDVPLDKAYQSGYYDAMVNLIRGMFSQAFKTNDSLQFAVLTGCLRISKESIFTGMNNFSVHTVNDVLYGEAFGFTDEEVNKMLEYYGFPGQYDAIKEWYDGYRFGNREIYCPWDVINYCFDLCTGNADKPKNYWVNTSGNDLIRKFIDKADAKTKMEMERLIDGESVKKMIRQELTYRDLDSDIDNLWSILFTTGYLTQVGGQQEGMSELVIPNREIRWIYVQQIREWFRQETAKDMGMLDRFCRAFEENDVSAIEQGFTAYLKKTISIRDTNTKKSMKENFYHGILLGLFGHMGEWLVMSNAESGDGYGDILIENVEKEIGIVIELKYADHADFDAACGEAVRQIAERNYDEALLDDGMRTIRRYGIACYKKRCKVISG